MRKPNNVPKLFDLDPDPMPRLTEALQGPVRPDRCQSCGGDSDLDVWTEHDDLDRPENRYLVLCRECSGRIIKPHPRLYDFRPANEPLPGVMALCVACRHRDGLRCRMSLASGGPGIRVRYVQPHAVHVDGTRGGRRCGWTMLVYPHPPEDCTAREVVSEADGERS